MKRTIATLAWMVIMNISWAQTIDQKFFSDVDAFFKKHVKNGLLDYINIKKDKDFTELINIVESADYGDLEMATKKAYLINVYNLIVVNEAVRAYPISSVQDIAGFFDRKKVTIAGQKTTLTDFEKKELLDAFDDPRLHFVLVCGALGCPPITDFAYQPDELDKQLDAQTRLALNDSKFIYIEDGDIQLSQIFKWYAADFGNSKSNILAYINNFRDTELDASQSVDYYPYDWSLNAASTAGSNAPLAANATRYIVSSTIPKGQIELKIFNNLYSQVTGDGNRSSFFTTNTSFLYGINRRFNLGFNSNFRRVLNSGTPSSPFDVLTKPESGQFRTGITNFGPQIRWAPYPKWQNFSIQSRLVFPIGNNLSGGNGEQFIDWSGPSFVTQFFNDRAIGTRFSLFTELGLWWEDIGRLSRGRINQVSTPLTAILSFSPTGNSIIYALGQFTPYYRIPFDYFIQGGVGAKYQFTRNIELELLYTGFTNTFLINNDGGAATYNVGFRFNI